MRFSLGHFVYSLLDRLVQMFDEQRPQDASKLLAQSMRSLGLGSQQSVVTIDQRVLGACIAKDEKRNKHEHNNSDQLSETNHIINKKVLGSVRVDDPFDDAQLVGGSACTEL